MSPIDGTKRKKKFGGALAEFSVALIFLFVLLEWLLDTGQRIGQVSWLSNIGYQVAAVGVGTDIEERCYQQNNLLGTLLARKESGWGADPASYKWRLRKVQSPMITTQTFATNNTLKSTVSGTVQSIIGTKTFPVKIEFESRATNNLPSVTSTYTIAAASGVAFSCCGEKCGGTYSYSGSDCYVPSASPDVGVLRNCGC